MEWLHQIVVSAGAKSFDDVVFTTARRQQNDVHWPASFSNAPADFQTIHSGHHPVENRQDWTLLGTDCSHRFVSISREDGAKTPIANLCADYLSRDRVVISDNYRDSFRRERLACRIYHFVSRNPRRREVDPTGIGFERDGLHESGFTDGDGKSLIFVVCTSGLGMTGQDFDCLLLANLLIKRALEI